MADLPTMQTSEFVTKSYDQKKYTKRQDGRQRTQANRLRRSQRSGREEKDASSLLRFMGVATMACTLLLVVALSGTTVIVDTVQSVQQVLQSDYPVDEALGKLKFVQNGLATVFGASASELGMPIQDATMVGAFDENSGEMELQGASNGDVTACEDGIVTLLGEGGNFRFIEVSHDNGLVSRYSMLQEICVENEQPVKRGDALGKTGRDGTLLLALLRDGVMQDPAPYLGISGS